MHPVDIFLYNWSYFRCYQYFHDNLDSFITFIFIMMMMMMVENENDNDDDNYYNDNGNDNKNDY